jgi:Xaa-Pro aminopeptidase
MSATKKPKTSPLAQLRTALQASGLDAFIVGSGDAHQSEYVAESEMRRQFLTGFTGSAGTALVLADGRALLWTDGRYFLQASQQLSEEWTLMRSGDPGVLELQPWLLAHLPAGNTVGVDPSLMSAVEARRLEEALTAKQLTLKAVDANPVDQVWAAVGGRPAARAGAVRVHEMCHAGQSVADKVAAVQAFLATQNAHAIVLSMLDEVAWLLNIRGSDVDYNPVVTAYAVVFAPTNNGNGSSHAGAHVFVDGAKVSNVADHLQASGVTVHAYDALEPFLQSHCAPPCKTVLDPAQVNRRIYQSLPRAAVVEHASPVAPLKALKNEAELAGIRACHVRDGAALTAFFHWLETTVAARGALTEYTAAAKLEEFRAKASPGTHMGPSFDTIAGYGANGAIIHYKPSATTAAALVPHTPDAMFLLDSGAQYLDGTTDVTRTVHFGTPTAHQRACYTGVLKGHIALATAVFPEGTIGSRIDCLARQALWSLGLDYNHGTGHGVGAFLNVHEGPQGIGFRRRENEAGFQASMTTSNEPGYYEDGAFGIRIENVCIAVEAPTPHQFNHKKSLRLETVTVTPIKAAPLLDVAALTPVERAWLNGYHAQVRAALRPVMEQVFPESVAYLVKETEPV